MTLAWFALALAVCSNVVANISLKLAVKKASETDAGSAVAGFLLQPWTWLGVCAAVVLLGSFLVAIRELGIGISYATVTSLALVLITLLAAMIFKEPLNLAVFVGIALIVSGIVVLMAAQAIR